ncbi:MAG: palmitoyltransferase pfa5 [Trizodia sp. TS-e1964]|nr:MAG: palmitoyltransferase pfa5 [Trizodia sp. TS-e1964]
MATICNEKAANLWVSRIIPLVLIIITAYATWVVVVLVCVDYLIQPDSSSSIHGPRLALGVVGIVLYLIFTFLMAWSYFRIIHVILTNPGYVPRSAAWLEQDRLLRSKPKRRLTKMPWGRDLELGNGEGGGEYPGNGDNNLRSSSQSNEELEQFYSKDVFVCQPDGRPIWCTTCLSYKPDRAHHCREVGRCVLRMDHFCPWVGGIVSETNIKFFIQFNFYTGIYCLFNIGFLASLVAESAREMERVNSHWIVALALASFFFLFGFGMAASTIQMALINTTTVENIDREAKVTTLAVYLPLVRPPSRHNGASSQDTGTIVNCMVTYAPPRRCNAKMITSSSATRNQNISDAVRSPPKTSRTFVILKSPPGAGIWDLGPWKNLKSIMGETFIDFMLPFRYSPITNHSSSESMYPLGNAFRRMCQNASKAPESSKATSPDSDQPKYPETAQMPLKAEVPTETQRTRKSNTRRQKG